jgi:3-methyl-2-oxobutanoate hydroxymethyltransferase
MTASGAIMLPQAAINTLKKKVKMSAQAPQSRLTVSRIRARKGGEPIVCLTAYSAPVAKLLDPHVDLILVGDSVGMVVHGHENTIPVTLDAMILHAQAVVRATQRALVVVDLPFGSYEAGPEQAFASAARVMKETGATAIKLEGGQTMAASIAFLTARGIPVMGHIGLQPQSVQQNGYRATGRRPEDWNNLKADAKAVEDAGAFSIVLEATVEPLAEQVAAQTLVPLIGIGATAKCDGQILVVDDMLGLSASGRVPSFVKKYADLNGVVEAAVRAYAADVRARTFPGPEHVIKPV